MQTSRQSLPELHLLSSPRLESKRTKNSAVSAMCRRRSTPHTKRGLGNTSRKDRFVTFSDVANNPICPQNGFFSICGETKCPAMVLLKFQHKEHLWEELSFYCVQFASKLTVLRLSKVFTFLPECTVVQGQRTRLGLQIQTGLLLNKHKITSSLWLAYFFSGPAPPWPLRVEGASQTTTGTTTVVKQTKRQSQINLFRTDKNSGKTRQMKTATHGLTRVE